MDLERMCTNNIIKLLDNKVLTRESYQIILLYILRSYRFSTSFCKLLQELVLGRLKKDLYLTPSPAGNEA